MKPTNSTQSEPSSYCFGFVERKVTEYVFYWPPGNFVPPYGVLGGMDRPMTWNGLKKEVKVDSHESVN